MPIIFLDRVIIDLKKLSASTIRTNGKLASLLIALTLNGDMIKPLCILSTDIMYNGLYEYRVLLYAYTNNGLVDDTNLIDWFEYALGKFEPLYFVSQEFDFILSKSFCKYLNEKNIGCITFPRGTCCLLSPFRKIIPLLIATLNEEAQKIARLEDIKDDAYLAWISFAIDRIFQEHPKLTEHAFDVLLS